MGLLCREYTYTSHLVSLSNFSFKSIQSPSLVYYLRFMHQFSQTQLVRVVLLWSGWVAQKSVALGWMGKLRAFRERRNQTLSIICSSMARTLHHSRSRNASLRAVTFVSLSFARVHITCFCSATPFVIGTSLPPWGSLPGATFSRLCLFGRFVTLRQRDL